MKLNQQMILKFLTENKSFLREKFHVVKIGIFGSFARNEEDPDSDIDILIELENNVSNVFDLKWSLREFLKNQFHRKNYQNSLPLGIEYEAFFFYNSILIQKNNLILVIRQYLMHERCQLF